MQLFSRHLVFVFFIVFISMPVSALVLNRVGILDDQPAPGFNTATQLVGERVYYVDSESFLNVSDGTSGGTRTLVDRVARTSGFGNTSMAALGDTLYFIRGNSVDSIGRLTDLELWQTDGTLANTRQAEEIDRPGFEFQRGLRAFGNRLFAISPAGDLLVSDGTRDGTLRLPPQEPMLETLCFINDDNYYLFDAQTAGSPAQNGIIHINNGRRDIITLDDPNRIFQFSEPIAKIGEQCIYKTLEADNELVEQLVSLDVDGSQIHYVLPINSTSSQVDRFVSATQFEDSAIVFRAFEISSGELFGLGSLLQALPGEQELLPVMLNGTQFPTNARRIAEIQVGAGTLYLAFRQQETDPPVAGSITVYDTDFNIIGGVSGQIAIVPDIPDLISLNGVDFFYDSIMQRIDRVLNSQFIRAYDVNIDRFIFEPGEDNQAVYAIGTDDQSGLSSIYRLETEPNVSERLVGIWGNSLFNRSGVQINTALGGDGQTRFLFLALLAHSEGEPLWIAGSAPIIGGRNQISMDMRLTTELDFLVPDEELFGQRTEVGTARLTVLGCDRIRIVFDLIDPFGSHNRVFERAVDTAFAPLCSDDVQQ